MRDILLLTNKEINADACLEKIREIYPNAKENGNGIMIEAKFRAYLTFTDEKSDSSDDLREGVNLSGRFVSILEVYRSSDAKRIITAMKQLYSDLYVILDDENEWSGTAQEFTETDFNF